MVDDLANRLRRLGTRQWREQLGAAGETAADLVYALIIACATVEGELSGDRPPRAPSAPDRPPYDAALADRLAVTGRDLAEAVAERADQRVGGAVLAGLLVYAKDLRLPRDPALVEMAWVATRTAGSARAAPEVAGDDLLDLIAQRLPGVRQLRLICPGNLG